MPKNYVMPTFAQARKVLKVVDAGLIGGGVGDPTPGKMCVEAAVAYAMGYDFDDEPKCVLPEVRRFKIELNDLDWSGPKARAKGLRRVAIAQLGSNGVFTSKQFRDALRIALVREFGVLKDVLKLAEATDSKSLDASLRAAVVTFELKPRKAIDDLNALIYNCSNADDADDNEVDLARDLSGFFDSLDTVDTSSIVSNLYENYYDSGTYDKFLTRIANAGEAALRALNCPGIAFVDKLIG